MLLTLNQEFLKLLNSVFSKNSILNDTFYNFNTYFNYLKQSTNTPIDYDNYILKFPYYSNNYKLIKELYPSGSNFKISTYKIVNSIPINNLFLEKQNFIDNIITTNTLIEKIPTNINDIKFSFLTQKIIIDDNFIDNFLLNYSTIPVPDSYNLSYNLLTNLTQTIHTSYNNINLLEFINIFNILYNIYNQYCKYDDIFLTFINTTNESDETFTNDTLIESFSNFTTNINLYFDSDEIFKNLSKIILKNNFNIIKPTNYILNIFTDYYKSTEINNLNTAFSDFINNEIADTLKNRLVDTLYKLQNIIFYHIFNDFIENDLLNYIDEKYLYNLHVASEFDDIFDDEFIKNLVININKFEFKHYLMPIYKYSSNPIKFINILMPFILDFVHKYLLTNTEFIKLIDNNTSFKNAIDKLIEKLISSENNEKITNLTNFFNNIDISSIYNTNKLGSLFSFMFIKDILIEFCNSTYFNNFIINSLANLNSFLYNNKIILYDYNYFNNIELIKSYLKTFFLKYSIYYNSEENTVNNYIYPELKLKLDEFFDDTTNFDFNITYDEIYNNISSQTIYDKLYNNNYNLTKNIYRSYVAKIIYQKVLNFYSIPVYSAKDLNFENILDSINTTDKTLNKMVYDNTTDKYLYSSGTLAESTWGDIQGNIFYSPVTPDFVAGIDDFEDIAASINTTNKTLNKMVWDTNYKIYVYASGTLPESSWKNSSGKIIYAPT